MKFESHNKTLVSNIYMINCANPQDLRDASMWNQEQQQEYFSQDGKPYKIEVVKRVFLKFL